MGPKSSTASREKALSGLKPWKKGQSGNPQGRRVEAEHVRNIIKQAGEDIATALVQAAKKDTNLGFRLLEQIIGKAPQSIELHGPHGGPIQTTHVDLGKLSLEQLKTLKGLIDTAAIHPTGTAPQLGPGGSSDTPEKPG